MRIWMSKLNFLLQIDLGNGINWNDTWVDYSHKPLYQYVGILDMGQLIDMKTQLKVNQWQLQIPVAVLG